MYVGRNHSATIATVSNAEFVCVHCEFTCKAMVTGLGEGTGRSPYFLDNDGARDRARDQAVGEARSNMHWALAGATCPKCGKCDRSARRHVYGTSAAIGVGYGALVGGCIVVAFKGASTGWWLGAIAALVIAIGSAVMRSQRLLTGAMLELPPELATRPRFGR